MQRISIKFDEFEFNATLFDTPTADAILSNLPMEGRAEIWGNEIYFTVPVNIDREKQAKEEVEIGDLAFWPVGSAFCIFFGMTPASSGNKPQAISPVNVFGKIDGDIDNLGKVKPHSLVRVIKID